MIIRELESGRRFKCYETHIGPTLGRKLDDGPPYEVWGKRYDAHKDRWTTKNGLYYINAYEIESKPL